MDRISAVELAENEEFLTIQIKHIGRTTVLTKEEIHAAEYKVTEKGNGF